MNRFRWWVLGISLGCLVPMVADAADPGFCGDYARAAVNQARIGYSVPYCAPGMRGARWSENFRTHYDWCLGAPYGAAQSEREIRREYLISCRGR